MKLRNILILFIVLIVLACTYFIFQRNRSFPPSKPVLYIWDIEDGDLKHITISLPRENKEQSFIKISKGDRFPWFFDDPQRSRVDTKRWGGGIPLLLSGPSANRIIAENATHEQLRMYGLTQPSMEITLTLVNKEALIIEAGDSTPNGSNYYLKVHDRPTVATVDFTWYHVLKDLVMDPPYASDGMNLDL